MLCAQHSAAGARTSTRRDTAAPAQAKGMQRLPAVVAQGARCAKRARCAGLSTTPIFHRAVVQRSRDIAAMAAAEPSVLIPVGTGTEEMEAVITIDVLRRAGADVTVASVEDSLEVTCSRRVKLVADALISDVKDKTFDLIACPGGMPGAERLRDSVDLQQLLAKQRADGRLYAAICATPAVFFGPAGLLDGHKATAHPAFSDKLSDQSAVSRRVVEDGKLTTSRGPGTAFEFALSLVRQLYGEDKAKQVAGPMVMYDYSL